MPKKCKSWVKKTNRQHRSLITFSEISGNSISNGAMYAITLSFAKDYMQHNIRCNCISPPRIYTPFVDGFIANNYPGKELEMFQKLCKSQPFGRMGIPEEFAAMPLYLCSGEAAFITGSNY